MYIYFQIFTVLAQFHLCPLKQTNTTTLKDGEKLFLKLYLYEEKCRSSVVFCLFKPQLYLVNLSFLSEFEESIQPGTFKVFSLKIKIDPGHSAVMMIRNLIYELFSRDYVLD